MKNNVILLEANPKGKFTEGYISGTPKPGTIMQVKAATEPVHGRLTWEVFNQAADGTQAVIAVLLEDIFQGKDHDDAYETGKLGRLYFPAMGEELNILVLDIAGTGDDFAIADRFMVDDTTGKLVADSSGASVPFIALETVTDPTADHYVHCMFTGY